MARNFSAGQFPTTHWSRILRAADPAAPDAREALVSLCTAYWYPLYTLIRRHGHPPEAASDLTQDYFVRLLERGVLGAADRSRGRFRAFLRTDCGFFLSHRREKDRALKRGGGIVTVSIDARDAEARYLREPADDLTPERLFDRSWALTLLDRVLEQLAQEYGGSGRGALFERLQFVLTDGSGSVPYATVAAQLGTTETAVQAAVRRLRRRYRTILREQIGATLDDPTEAAIDDEIRALFTALER
jgi:RNA polymerase sigma-70 factor (ECF subfamily)